MTAAAEALDRRIWAALRDVQDPEMPVNLVDLGLIYGVHTSEGHVQVRLTFTAMGCPATEMIIGDVRERLLREPGVESIDVEIVWDPPWSAARMTPGGRAALVAWGLSV